MSAPRYENVVANNMLDQAERDRDRWKEHARYLAEFIVWRFQPSDRPGLVVEGPPNLSRTRHAYKRAKAIIEGGILDNGLARSPERGEGS